MIATTETIAQSIAGPILPARLSAVVGGDWSRAGGAVHDVLDPASEAVVSQFVEAPVELVNEAVADAHDAWRAGWRDLEPARRGRILYGVAAALREHADVLARLESLDCGKPLSQARTDVEVSARYFEYYAGAVDKFGGETIPQPAGTFAYTVRAPYGVIGHVTPWNAPISQMMRGVAPSLAAGNTVVVKPSELTPITSLLAAKIMVEAGLPAGVCNVVPGTGPLTGEALVRHELVQHVTFTGSVRTGRHVGRIAADRLVGCNLELGGKSPSIILADADLDRAARAGALAVIRNSGQSCFATTRLVVDRRVEEQLLDKMAEHFAGLTVGPGLEDPDVGPLISEDQRRKVLGYLDTARTEGARVVVGGGPSEGRSRGHFVEPTLLAGVTNDMTVAREEIFGPVQSVIAFDDVDEAIAIANDTLYGLSAGVFTSDVGAAHRVAARLDAGQVQVNRYTGAGVEVPFGGYKNSGLGREKGLEALHHYTQVKSVIVAVD
ncbi:aldehyde dehydrogenase family protein [Streptomyces sp. NPDC057376]|uniref:aldehyde dehydrogenase family protein n=1 Tax=Streptomyces sp. NPDC057376 TaxID=3346110 RepID=UPI003630D8C7